MYQHIHENECCVLNIIKAMRLIQKLKTDCTGLAIEFILTTTAGTLMQ